jgi:hypothetical protein
MRVSRRSAIVGLTSTSVAVKSAAAQSVLDVRGGSPPTPPQPITSLTPTSVSLAVSGSIGQPVCTFAVTMSRASPPFSGSLTLDGTHASEFALTGNVLTVGVANLSVPYRYNITITPHETGVVGDGVAIPVTINALTRGATRKLITSVTAGNLRDDYTGNGPVQWFGMWVTVGPNPITVTSVGRYNSGNGTRNHPVVIIDAKTGTHVPNGHATVKAASAGHNQFAYAALPDGGSVLAAGRQYYILSRETEDNDQFCDSNTTVTYQTDATVSGSVVSVTNLDSFGSGGPTGSTCGPLDLQYTIGGTPMLVGTPFPWLGDQHNYQTDNGNYFYVPEVSVVSGTITLDGRWYQNSRFPILPTNTVTVEWVIDDNTPNVVRSPYILGPADQSYHNNFPWTLDTTTLADGTHSFYVRFVDSVSGKKATNPYLLSSFTGTLIVQNKGPLNGLQRVPLNQAGQPPARLLNPSADWVTYPGSPTSQTVTPYPSPFVPPSSKTSLRNASNYYIENWTADHWHEYDTDKAFVTTPNGGVMLGHFSPQIGGNTIESQYAAGLCFQLYDGGRNDSRVSSYTSWVAAPDGSGFVAAEMMGRVVHLAWDGTVTTLAGETLDRTKLQLEFALATQLPEAQRTNQMKFIGQIGTPGFTDFRGLNDVCYDPRDPTHRTLYVACPRRHCIIKVDLSTNPPTLTRYAGQDGQPNGVDGWRNSGNPSGSEDGANPYTPIVNGRATEAIDGTGPLALFNEPYSIIMADGRNPRIPAGTMFVADFCNGAIRQISAHGTTVTTLVGVQPAVNPTQATSDSAGTYQFSPAAATPFAQAWVNFPHTLRFDSKGNILFLEIYHQTIRAVDYLKQTVTRVGETIWANDAAGGTWGWFDVDTAGACGPVDDIAVVKAIAGPAGSIWRISRDGTYSNWFWGDAAGATEEGPTRQGIVNDPGSGAYTWAICFAKTQARMLSGGYRHWGVMCWRSALPGDPPIDPDTNKGINIQLYNHGHSIWWHGTCVAFPWGSRPTFASLHGAAGTGRLGSTVARTFDAIVAAYPRDGDFTAAVQAPGTLGAFINGGMDGSVLRPEITGNDLRALCYYIRRTAMSGTYPKTVDPGPQNMDTNSPIISNVALMRRSQTSIQATWTTSKPTVGLIAGCSDAVYNNTNDAGLSQYNVWSPIESTFTTSHTETITSLPVVASGRPTHITILAKDIAGNSVYYPDQAVS